MSVGSDRTKLSLWPQAQDWDAVFVVGPYARPDALPAALKDNAAIAATDIESRDDVTVLVLAKDAKVVCVAPIARSLVDLSGLADRTLKPGKCFGLDGAAPPKATGVVSCS